MQGGQHKVTGERGLDGNLRGFKIANFTNHDDVGVLPQDGAQGFCKRQLDFGIDLGLANAGQFVLNRIFYCHDVAGAGIKPLQG